MRWTFIVASIICAATLVGCNQSTPKGKTDDGASGKKGEEEIKQAFTSLQGAIKAKDADKVWNLLAKDTQSDCEREAQAVKEAFSKMPESDKSGYEKKVGLSAKEISEATGKTYAKSSAFYAGETGEMPESKIDKVVRTGETTATLHYIEDDGKGPRETRSVVREDGQWRFALPVSKAVLK